MSSKYLIFVIIFLLFVLHNLYVDRKNILCYHIDMKNIEKKLNIGLFVDTFFPMIDGVINVVDNYARRLVKYANVTVFTIGSRDKNYVDNFPYKVVRCQKLDIPGLDYDLGMPTFDAKFQKELKESNLDIVHIHSPFTLGKVGLNYAKKHKIPCVATNHSQFKQDFFKATKSPAITDILLKTIMNVFNKCDENWSVNSEVAKVYDEYGLKEHAKVVNNATDMQFLRDTQFLTELKQKHNIKDNEKVLLFVGRINAIKNIFFTLDALEILNNNGFKFKMFYIGSGQDEEKLKEQIAEKKLQDRVFMLGRISDRKMLAGYYNIANLFLFPSMYDCASLVQIEAASQKTPTLFLKNSVTSDGITDNENGFFAENDEKQFAERIIDIFNHEEIYKQVCENCYKTVYVNWDKRVEQAFESYKKLIEQKKSRNKAIAKKSHYTKTIKSVKKQHQQKKEKERKKRNKILMKSLKYPKTIKKIRNS